MYSTELGFVRVPRARHAVTKGARRQCQCGALIPTATPIARIAAPMLPLTLADVGFSLKPPKWARKAGAALVKKLSVTIPTAGGPVTVTPDQAAQYAAALRGAQVQYGPEAPSSGAAAVAAAVESKVPGGWLTVAAAAGVLALLVMPRRARHG